MQSLPDSLLCEVFAKVPLSRAKVQATLVSKAFNTALHQPAAHSQATWKADEWLNYVPSLPIPVLKLALEYDRKCPRLPNTVHTLHLVAGASLVQHSCPAVEHLTWYLDEADMPSQVAVPGLFPNLRTPVPWLFPNLRTLALEGTPDFGDYEYMDGPFATACKGLHCLKHLKEFTYSGCVPIDISLPKDCVVRLSRVDSVSNADPDDPDANHVDLPHSVTSAIIDLTYAVWSSEVDLSWFAQFGSLQQLTLLLFEAKPWAVVNFEALPAAVTEVNIASGDRCNGFTPSYVQTQATYVPRLKAVGCHKFMDTFMGTLVVSRETSV
ncbi:hypothetical protein WJX72_010095 [[Myrmecia] bisecta]|uniref:F-box domain-containing protein n=1 Tax=[Myrmecia] bisecta TaxID=41462 RepID=A0AAW1QC20_9CHLO